MQPTADAESRSRWLGRLLDEHGAALALYAAQWSSEADDCVQEALVALAAENPAPENEVAWLYRVVKRRALNRTRGERRRTAHEAQAWQSRLARSASQELRRELLDEVSALPERQREIVVLKIWGGLSMSEAADVLGLSSSSVHRQYHEALTQLRKVWEIPCPGVLKTE